MSNDTEQSKQAQIKAELKETKVRSFGEPQQSARPAKSSKGQGPGRRSGGKQTKQTKSTGQGRNKTQSGREEGHSARNKQGGRLDSSQNLRRKKRRSGSNRSKSKQAADQFKPQDHKRGEPKQAERPKLDPKSQERKTPAPKGEGHRAGLHPSGENKYPDRKPSTPQTPETGAWPCKCPEQEDFTQQSSSGEATRASQARTAGETKSTSGKKERRSKSWLEMTAAELRQANEDLEEEILESISEISRIKLA